MAQCTHWLPSNTRNDPPLDCLCVGTGRFLRAVLVPILNRSNLHPVLVQTRGRNFLEFMHEQEGNSFPVDTVLESGDVQTEWEPCYGAFSWGQDQDRTAFYDWLSSRSSDDVVSSLRVIGLGVTEAGLKDAETAVMKHLYQLLKTLRGIFYHRGDKSNDKRICIFSTDNVARSGRLIQQYMEQLAEGDESMISFLEAKVSFLDSMVDRITSERPGSQGLVPRAEPVPAKALVLLDQNDDLPDDMRKNKSFGFVLRHTKEELEADIALKLRVANGTHTAIAHTLALQLHLKTDVLAREEGALFLRYLDALFEHQILPASLTLPGCDRGQSQAVYDDWRRRLAHPHFGLSSFFITQNGAAKGGIRLGPTVRNLIQQRKPVNVTMAFAFAALLRWLTPDYVGCGKGIYRGSFPTHKKDVSELDNTVEYADQLRYNIGKGWYEYRCDLKVIDPKEGFERDLSALLGSIRRTMAQPSNCIDIVNSYFLSEKGGNLGGLQQEPGYKTLVCATATLYARMTAGDHPLGILQEVEHLKHLYEHGMNTDCGVLTDGLSKYNQDAPLHYKTGCVPDTSRLMSHSLGRASVVSVVNAEVASAQVVDVHTHLLPPSHGALCLWGIDELLTYHYLVSEYFMTAPSTMTPETFYSMTKQQQADIVWESLFIDRMPLSEACRGVVTTIKKLGLSEAIESRSLDDIRAFYRSFRERGVAGAEDFSNLVHKLAGVRYNVMTNIPFNSNEAFYWRIKRETFSKHYRSALRVDPVLSGDTSTIVKYLSASGHSPTVEGMRQYLREWCDTMNPEYVMASTPHNFTLSDTVSVNRGVDVESMKQPGAFAELIASDNARNCNPEDEDSPSAVCEDSMWLREALMVVCEERDLPIALKIGAHRGVNPRMKDAGDGMVTFADAGMLGRLCQQFPRVRFLATFLSRNNQHEACVLASKFRNLHIYGCWWFCNNPSIIEEITQMRLEMLGSAFTCQHSDARVLDQLLYKWPHSRRIVANVLVEHICRLIESGWKPTRAEVRSTVKSLFGGSYEEFILKSLKEPEEAPHKI